MKISDLSFFDNLNEYVYAADTATYEIVYMNKKELERFGFKDLEEVGGRKCHEIMHNCYDPCAVCNNSKLCEKEFIERNIYDPILGTGLVIKNTLIKENGRSYRVEIAFDTSSAGWQQNKFSGLEAVVNNGLRLSTDQQDVNASIEVLLEYLGKALDAERTYIFEKQPDDCDNNTYEWTAAGISPEIDNLQNVPPEVCASWYKGFKNNKTLMIEDIEDIKETEPLQYETLKAQNIHSIVVVPLYDNGDAIGFYGVDNPPLKKFGYTENMLKIMGHFIVTFIKRRNLMQRLEEMSFTDHLTKLGNRHSMQVYVETQIENCESLGVLYCDITGLKRKNDTEGHKAGDKYIVDACECLKEAFDGYGLFRIGGDELLALCKNIDEKEFNDRIAKLKEKLSEKSVIMAVGSIYETGGKYDIDDLLNRSEALMYEEKSRYYRTSGIERRR